MTGVKGSLQYRSIVVRYRPWQRSALIVLICALLLAVMLISTWMARSSFTETERRLVIENSRLQKDLLRTQKERDTAEQQLANIQLGANIDRVAVSDVRDDLKNYQDTIAGLTEEISFYKGLMSPSERDRGLSIRSLDFYRSSAEPHIQFKLVLQQTAVKHKLLKGTVRIVLVGQQQVADGVVADRRYALADLSTDIDKKDIALRFKYFHNIEGELVLPVGFDVQKVELVARATEPKKVQIEKTYNWQLQEY